MSKSHFFIPYPGNKRMESERIINTFDLSNITTIVEPFCGTSALSFKLSQLYPKKFKYVLNDNCPYITELYGMCFDDVKLDKFVVDVNNILKTITNKDKFKCTRNNKSRKPNIAEWYIGYKWHGFRIGVYNLKLDYTKVIFTRDVFLNAPIVSFIKNENVIIKHGDGVACYKEYMDKSDHLLFLDPPYLISDNSYYSSYQNVGDGNIYMYLKKNDIANNTTHIYLCLEKTWIIELLFEKYKFISYDKTYQVTKKKTTHSLIYNKLLADPSTII